MNKIFFNRVPRYEPYGGGSHFVTAMCEYLKKKGHEVVFELDEAVDTIFMIDPRSGDIGYSINHILSFKEHFPNVKILHRINECDARKNTEGLDRILIESANRSDKVVFISNWLKEYFENLGFEKNKGTVIYNGCKLNHFYPVENKKPNKKIKLLTHHWSDNWMKGFDLYSKIDEWLSDSSLDFEFTYVGRYSKEYTPKNTKIIHPLHGKELGEELRKHDIYVTASRYEPCGMHHIEGAASGLPVIYHKETGGIVELCSKHGEEYETFNQFIEKLEKVKNNLQEYRKKIDYDFLDIERCCESFYNELLDMHDEENTLFKR